MARLGQSYAIEDLPDNEYELLKEGTYTVKITDTSVDPTKAGTGTILKITFDVLGPERAGAKIFHRINLVNPNPTAQKIGLQQLKALLTAVNIKRLEDSDQLLNKVCDVLVKTHKAEGDYEAYSEVKKISVCKGVTQATRPTTGTATTPSAEEAEEPVQKPRSRRPF